jgi:hypothetical protein
MNQVWGCEHTTNPPILIQPIADEPIIEGSTAGSTEPATPSPKGLSPSALPEDTPTPDSLFDSGKKVKPKKNDKSEVIVELMMQNLEIKENEMELKKDEMELKKKQREDDAAMLARAEEREQKLISIMELLVNHIIKKD